MLLSKLAEALADYLNSSPEKWAGNQQVVAKAELDPSKFMLPELGVYILPQFTAYQTDISRPRGRVNQINNIQYVSLVVSQVFTDLPTGDGVANWDEARIIIDTRERCERYLMTYSSPELTIADVDPQPVDELELDSRNFVALTTFGFQQVSCGSQYELSSSSTASAEDTGSAQIAASIRSRLSSGRRRGNQ